MANTRDSIIIEETFKRSMIDVWQAITQRDLMILWFFENIESFQAEVGFETQFSIQSGGRDFMHLWKIVEVVPLQKIVYDWRYEGFSGSSFVSFELFQVPEGVKLILTASGMETFPQDIPEFLRESCEAGWHYFIKDRLEKFLAAKLR